MTNKIIVRLALLAVVVVLVGISIPFPDNRTNTSPVYKTMSEARQVGIAAKLYANDHEGRLPATFQELVPDYLDYGAYFADMTYSAAGALIEELPPQFVIASKPVPPRRGQPTRVAVVHADLSVHVQKQ